MWISGFKGLMFIHSLTSNDIIFFRRRAYNLHRIRNDLVIQ